MDGIIIPITIFVLAVFVGYEIITKVPPTLHTPLMSGSNAISGVTVIGAILSSGLSENSTFFSTFFGVTAIIFATANIVGGFLITNRMLQMFKKKR